MRRLYYLTLGLFLLTVRAEADFQGYHTAKTKGPTVIKDLPLKKEIPVGHGTEVIPTETTHRNTALAVTAKFPGVVLFDTRPTPPHETIQITKAFAVFASHSRKHFVSRNGQNALTSLRDNPTTMRIHTESEIPLISNYGKIVFSSRQAAFESMRNGTSEPEVHLSADAVKSSLLLHILHNNRIQRSSFPLTSADRESGVPVLSASRPRVIDNLAALHNNGDERSQGKDENLRTNEYQFGTMQSVFQNDTAEDSLGGDTVTNLCLTCLRDRRAVSTEESAAQPALLLDGSSRSLSIKGLALDFNEFSVSLPSLHQQSTGEQEEKLNTSSHQNIAKHSGFGLTKQLLSNMTFPSLSFNKTVKSILNNSQFKTFLSDTVTVTFDTQSLGEMLSVTQKDTKKQLRHIPGKTFVKERPAPYHTSEPFHMLRKPVTRMEGEIFGERVSTGDPQSKLYFSDINKNAFHSLSTNLKNVFIQNQPLVVSSGSVSNTPVITETAHSGQKSVLPASNPTARMRLIEAHSTVAPFRFGRQTTSAVKHPEFHSLTERADSLISALRSQTPAKSSSQTKEPILSLLPKDSAIKVSSVTTETDLTDTHDSQTFNTLNSFVQQTVVDPSEPVSEPVLKEPQIPSFTTRNFVLPVTLLLSESRWEFVEDESTMTLTTLPSKSSTERLTMSRFVGTQSKITQEKTFDVTTHQSSATYNRDLIRKSQMVHNLKLGDKNEQVLTVAAEDQDKEIIKREGEGIKETKVKLHKEEESREGEVLENKKEELFKSDKIESGKQEKIINTAVEINHKTYRVGEKSEEHEAEKSQEDSGGSIEEEDVTLKRDKDPRQEEARDKKYAERKGVTKINTENLTKDVAAKQRESLTAEEAEARAEETESKEDLKHNREIGREDMTNVPLGATSDSKELNRDKGHTVINPSSCHSLIKQLGVGATEQKGIHLGENTAQTVKNNNKNKPFSYKVTSNHRQLHSPLRSRILKLSRVMSLPKEPYTQIKPCLSTLGAKLTNLGDTSSLTTESAKQLFEATFSMTAVPKKVSKHTSGVSASKRIHTMKPTISLHSSATKSAHPVLKSISKTSSLTTPQFAITDGFLRVQPHFSINSPTLTLSIIYSIANHRHEISSVSKANSLLQTTNERQQLKHITKAHVFESRVKDPLTSTTIENMSTSVRPAPPQQIYNDSSTRSPTDEALSSEAHVSIGRLQSYQGQSACQKSQSSSSSFDITSGQRCSFKLSEQTVHSDASHAPGDDNAMRPVQTLMASMSPKAKNDQFPLNNMSLVQNAMLLGGDSVPGTYSLTGITRSDSEKEILRADSQDEYANSGSGHAESLLETTDETSRSEENDGVQTILTSAVKKQTDAVNRQMMENRNEKNKFGFIAQTLGRRKHPANSTDEFSSRSKLQSEKLAVKTTNDNDHNHLFNVDGNDEANKTVKSTLDNNHLSLLDGYNETSAKAIVSTIRASHKTEQAINEDVLPVMNDFAATGSTAFVESHNLPEILKIPANDVTKCAISDMEHHPAKTIEKQHDSSTPPPGAVSQTTITCPHIHFRSDPKVPKASTQQIDSQIMNATTTTKTNDFVSPAAGISGSIVSTEAHKSMLTTSESTQVVIKKAAHAEGMAQTNSHIEPLSLRDTTPGKYTPAVKRENATETQNIDQHEHKISVQVLDLSHGVPPGMTVTEHPITDPVQAALLKDTQKAAGTPDRTPTTVKQVEYSSFKDMKTAQTTKSFFHERTSAEHTQDRADTHQYHQTSISQVILGAMTDSVPPTESINKANCSTIGCAKSGETTKTTNGAGEMDHTAENKMSRKQAAHTGKDTPDTKAENGNCSTDSPVPGKATPQAANIDYSVLSPATSISDRDHATVEESMTKNAKSMTDEPSTRTLRAVVERDHLERPETHEQAQFVEKTTQRHPHRETSEDQEAAEVILSEPGATTVQTNIKSTEWTMHTEKHTITQSYRGVGQNEKFETQNITRAVYAAAKGETADQESGRKLLLLAPRLKHRRKSSPHLYLSGVTEVSEDLCGSGNYTAEMSLNLERGIEPGDAVPALGNLRVVINLKTNNSRVNLEVTSCCLSPTIQPDLTNSTCCLFSRLAAEPVGITLLPSALSTSASFTISLFQMINYSVVYLHCDLSVCLRNRSNCERECLQQRSAFPLESPEAIVTNLRNRISFGPMLKEVKNSTFLEAIEPPELDLVLIIVSLVVGSSLVTVMLLLVWLAYRHRAIWPLHSAAPPRACCGCMHPGGDLILP